MLSTAVSIPELSWTKTEETNRRGQLCIPGYFVSVVLERKQICIPQEVCGQDFKCFEYMQGSSQGIAWNWFAFTIYKYTMLERYFRHFAWDGK